MFNGCCNEDFGAVGFLGNPAFQIIVACGHDRNCYISTARLAPYPYTTNDLIVARFGSMADLITATDDDNTGSLNATILANIIANVTSEINGFLTTIYPIPLAQTGTVAILQVSQVSTDGLGTVLAVIVVEAGNYSVAPALTNSPAYLRYIDPLANVAWFNDNSPNCCQTQKGTGLSLTVAYTPVLLPSFGAPQMVSGTPAIAAGGTGYCVNDLIVLTGGQSYVPDKITSAATLMCCFELMRRRISPRETNYFWDDTKAVKKELLGIGNGELDLDGTYKRFYSAIASWNQESVLFGANSL